MCGRTTIKGYTINIKLATSEKSGKLYYIPFITEVNTIVTPGRAECG
jgi:hypothetical protein